LTTAFYNNDPTVASTVLLPPLFAVPDSVKLKTATFSTFIAGAPAGNIYAVVNDSGTTIPLQLPNVIHLPESNYTNNDTSLYYQPQQVQLQPADTTVLKKTSFQYTILTPVINPASTAWAQGDGYTLNCYNCGAPTATIFDSATVTMQTANQFGCLITGTATVKILPPDMTVKIINSQCYNNDTVLVFFTVCMNNNYDSVFANLPVAFYNGDPTNGGAQLLQPVFYTKQAVAGNCDTFFCAIAKPATNKIYASVNDNGRQTATYRVYEETDYTNDIADTAYTPFTVAIVPADTSIMYGTSTPLVLNANGGTVTNAAWWPNQFLSCANCLAPVATPDYSLGYQAEARNQYFCIDTAYAVVKTYRGPPDVSIPSAFTPNGDGVNDVFYILGVKDAALIKNFAVYNRWGNAVFRVSNVVPNTPVYGWDGSVNGVKAQQGTYVYEVTMQFADGSQKNYKGTVVLIR
jgi:gliding motility-associated-like protein